MAEHTCLGITAAAAHRGERPAPRSFATVVVRNQPQLRPDPHTANTFKVNTFGGRLLSENDRGVLQASILLLMPK